MSKLPKKPKEIEAIQSYFRDHRLSRFIINRVYELMFYAMVFLTPLGWKKLMDPAYRNYLLSKEFGKGFLVDSILQNPIYIPDGHGQLTQKKVGAGIWAGYDFHRFKEFPTTTRQYREGKLGSMLLEEIRDNPAGMYTPTSLVNPLNIQHMFSIDFPSIEDLINKEMIRQTTYKSAFRRAGHYEMYARSLDLLEISDKPLFQVTPKGNSLIFLGNITGDSTPPKKDYSLELKPV